MPAHCIIDPVGKKYNRLTVVSEAPRKGKYIRYMNCLCECGTAKLVKMSHLIDGRTKSCGCFHSEQSSKRTKMLHETGRINTVTHGYAKSKIYGVYYSMIRRCSNPKANAYKDYGGRGIKVCGRWMASFENFFEDMGTPKPKETIERLNNALGYCKENCEWATRKIQQNNRRNNHNITFAGKTQTLTQWSEEIGIHHNTLFERIKRGLPVEEVLSPKLISNRKYEFDGEVLSANGWCKKLNLNLNTFNERIRQGWSMEEIARTPVLRRRRHYSAS